MREAKVDLLVVDDDPDFVSFVEASLQPLGFLVRSCDSFQDAVSQIEEDQPDVVLADVHLGETSGIELCARIGERFPNLPVVVTTGRGSIEVAVSAIRAGAYDFVTKPPDVETLRIALERACTHRDMRAQVQRLERAVIEAQSFEGLVGASPGMRRVFDLIDRVADSDASVLITGESGTGKELVARALHTRSRRKKKPFVALSCAAIPEALLESELFGHAKGAFTDARNARSGLFEQANGGTLFLDEIGDMPLSLQPKLLRALQERSFRPIGSNIEVPFDARIVAATHRDLEAAVEAQSFRMDLYFRIDVVRIKLPPLRTRDEDSLLIAERLLKTLCERSGKSISGFSEGARRRILGCAWPGNVRELANAVERAVAVSRDGEISENDLPETLVASSPGAQAPSDPARGTTLGPLSSDVDAELLPLAEIERRHIHRVMDSVSGNKTLAARVLGLDRKTLYRKLGREK